MQVILKTVFQYDQSLRKREAGVDKPRPSDLGRSEEVPQDTETMGQLYGHFKVMLFLRKPFSLRLEMNGILLPHLHSLKTSQEPKHSFENWYSAKKME